MITRQTRMISLLRCFTVINYCLCGIVHSTTHSAFFVSYTPSNESTETESSLVTDKMFHKCSMMASCSYVLQDMVTMQYRMSKSETVLPKDRQNYRLWMKMKAEKQEKEKAPSELKSCREAQQKGMTTNGIIELSLGKGSTVNAYCDMMTDGGGWTVIQRRIDNNVTFDRNWDEYVKGFGNLSGSFWLGLEAIHQLTKDRNATLRFDLQNIKRTTGYAKYSNFKVQGKATNYQISLGAYDGDVGDGMSMSNGMGFSTSDKDNDNYAEGSCAHAYKGPWWYNRCAYVRLNSPFPTKENTGNSVMKWNNWSDGNGTIIYSEIKLREEA